MAAQEQSDFHEGKRPLQIYFVALIVATMGAVYAFIQAESLATSAGLDEKLVGKFIPVLQMTFGVFAAWWALEAVHVRLSLRARALLAVMDEAERAADLRNQAAAFRQGDWALLVHQVVLGVACFLGFVAMAIVPGFLRHVGVKDATAASVTLLVWLSYFGPVVFAAFRFHHVGLTRRTREQMAERLDRIAAGSDGA